MIIAGSGIYETCEHCNKMVKVNKFLFGGLHVCVPSEEYARTSQLGRNRMLELERQDYERGLRNRKKI